MTDNVLRFACAVVGLFLAASPSHAQLGSVAWFDGEVTMNGVQLVDQGEEINETTVFETERDAYLELNLKDGNLIVRVGQESEVLVDRVGKVFLARGAAFETQRKIGERNSFSPFITIDVDGTSFLNTFSPIPRAKREARAFALGGELEPQDQAANWDEVIQVIQALKQGMAVQPRLRGAALKANSRTSEIETVRVATNHAKTISIQSDKGGKSPLPKGSSGLEQRSYGLERFPRVAPGEVLVVTPRGSTKHNFDVAELVRSCKLLNDEVFPHPLPEWTRQEIERTIAYQRTALRFGLLEDRTAAERRSDIRDRIRDCRPTLPPDPHKKKHGHGKRDHKYEKPKHERPRREKPMHDRPVVERPKDERPAPRFAGRRRR